MNILAIETSTSDGSVALLREGRCVFAKSFTSERSHNSQIFAPLGEALEAATPDLIVAGTGPGSYTGARIGIAAGIGISLTHGARMIGIPSVRAAEVGSPESTYHLVGDARRSRFFYAKVAARQLIGEPELIDAEELASRMSSEEEQFVTFDKTPPAGGGAGFTITRPTAEILGGIAATLTKTEIETLASGPVVPYYMSAPFVTAPKKR